MRLEGLSLEGFRNYERLEAEFDPGVNLIVGDNAQGKTNLLEAMVYLSTGRSYRTRREQELIRFGADFARLTARVAGQRREQTMEAVLFSGRRPRQLFLNGVKKKTAGELAGVLTTVLFCPEDLLVLKSGAAARRRLMDGALSQLRPNYEAALSLYTRAYEQKSQILKQRFEAPSLLQVLPEYNRQLCQAGAAIISYRARFLEALGAEATAYHRSFSGGREALTVEYRTVSTVEDPFAPLPALREALEAHMESHARAELEAAQCLSGPHKDDFDLLLDGMSLKSFGSQGQVRTAAISLKLAQRALFLRDTGEEPVLLLDDVLSELDPGRQDFVLNQIRTGQVFITCCESGRLTELGRVLHIAGGRLAGVADMKIERKSLCGPSGSGEPGPSCPEGSP